MQLLEYEAKMIFSQQGIAIPKGELIQSLEELRELSGKFSFPVVLKAQVPVGGRKKVGGIMIAHDQNDVEAGVRSLLGMRIRGCMVRKILLEEYLNTEREAYLSVSIDASKGTPLILASSVGGVDIEDIARIHPEKVVAKTVDIACDLNEDIAAELARRTELEDISLGKIVDTLKRLYEIFVKYDALLVEANPLVMTTDRRLCAVGAAMTIDDDALHRHPDIACRDEVRIEDEIERDARKEDIAYVGLNGDVGIVASGAGLALATLDLVKDYGGNPANFLDTGGQITQRRISACMKTVLRNKRVRGLIINMYGGINPMVEAAKGVASFVREKQLRMPVVVKVRGNQEEEAWRILEEAGVTVVKSMRTEIAIQTLMELMGK